MSAIDKTLLNKYDVPAPRYTSYPTVPYWSDSPTSEQWLLALRSAFETAEASWSMYIHIPYCETLCTFCGCNTTITRNHDREQPYVNVLLKEWELYKEKVPEFVKAPLKQLHLGGGTPTFLSSDSLRQLLTPILEQTVHSVEDFEASIEVDPRRTNQDQLETLYSLGFRRISLGVQDFDPEVQRLVNRVQPYEMVRDLTVASRELGYDSINYDLIYGLPKQTKDSIAEMAQKTVELRPDRIALYSLAVVPWIKPAQRLFKDEDLPVGAEKRELYDLARAILMDAGYKEIGMDHFALPEDSLFKATESKTLHRNFMGYSDSRTDVMLGLGVSAISEAPTCFHQNEKVLPVYERMVNEGQVASLRGHLLTEEDQHFREKILQFMTRFEVQLDREEEIESVSSILAPLVEDELVKIEGTLIKMTEQGKPFLRNACMALDQRLLKQKPQTKVFSQSL